MDIDEINTRQHFTIPETAELLGVTYDTVYKWVRRKLVPSRFEQFIYYIDGDAIRSLYKKRQDMLDRIEQQIRKSDNGTETSLLITREVAEILGIDEGVVRNMIRDHRIPAVRRGRDWLIKPTDLRGIAPLRYFATVRTKK